jgi:hypothetical protein
VVVVAVGVVVAGAVVVVVVVVGAVVVVIVVAVVVVVGGVANAGTGEGTAGDAIRCFSVKTRFSSDWAVSGSAGWNDATSFASISPAAVTVRICGAPQQLGCDDDSEAAADGNMASSQTVMRTRRPTASPIGRAPARL